MTDPTTAMTDLIRERGPMTQGEIALALHPEDTMSTYTRLFSLLASGHVIRRERECEVCHGKGRVSRERERWDGEWITASEPCLHCTVGKQTVYELASP